MGATKVLLVLSLFAALISNQGGTDALLTNIFNLLVNYGKDRIIQHFVEDAIETTRFENLNQEYDFIVVGSGSAGSVVASRLAENTNWRVLLLEVGYSEVRSSWVPFFAGLLQWTGYNWAYRAQQQENACKGMDQERCALPRGRGLGGTSNINYMLYSRGNRIDYDRLGAANAGWGYDDVLPYFRKLEQVRLDRPFAAGTRGTEGPLQVETSYYSDLTTTFVAAGAEMGLPEFDYNGGDELGFSYPQATLRKGRRLTIARAYLERPRRNLHILTGAMADKIIIDPVSMQATAVQYTYKRKSYQIKCSKEIIVSAGAYGSPKLLMLSGIGPEDHLASKGIETLKDLPVGRNLQDHVAYVGLDFLVDQSPESPLDAFNPVNIANWISTGKGPLASLGGCTGMAFIKTNATAPGRSPDIALALMSLGSLHTDFGWFNRRFLRIRDEYYREAFRPMEGRKAFTIFPTLLNPTSKGFLELRSTDSMDDPIIRHNYLSTDEDRRTLIAGIRASIQVALSDAFKKYATRLSTIPVPDCENLQKDSDEYWNCAIERFTISMYDEVGTCAMGNATHGVVDAQLRVHGVARLRVADTSVIPFALSANTHAPAAMFGEKLADIIKNNWV